MKKQKPNRAAKKNRNKIKRTAAYEKRKETQYYQRQAEKRGILHPRGLARSVAASINGMQGDSPTAIAGFWRGIIYRLPRNGQKYLYPERHGGHSRKIRKAVPGTDCSSIVMVGVKKP